MAESIETTELKLKLLGDKVQAGWLKLHPGKQVMRDAVREALIQQRMGEGTPKNRKAKKAQEEEVMKLKNDRRHKHGH